MARPSQDTSAAEIVGRAPTRLIDDTKQEAKIHMQINSQQMLSNRDPQLQTLPDSANANSRADIENHV